MKIKAIQKYVRMSPRKLRLVAEIARQMEPEEAIIKLPFLKKRAKGPIIKTIKTALANGQVIGLMPEQLEFDEIQVNEGPRLKRGRAVSRGRWHPYQRKMSHIRVILKTKEDVKEKPKERKESSEQRDVKEKPKRISLDQIKKIRMKKDDNARAEKEVIKDSRKLTKKTARDIKAVRTTNK